MILGDVWIVGDSIISHSSPQLVDWPQVRWNGLGGAQYSDVPKLLSQLAVRWPSPSLLIVHIGTNDLVGTDFFCMRQRIELFMRECNQFFPEARLVWSDILPRACYFGAINPARMEMKRRAINRWAWTISRRLDTAVLHHPQFRWCEFSLFRYDGVHLSQTGTAYFQANIPECISAFFS